MPYAELHAKSNFSFLEGASHAEELVERAVELGYTALAVTDRNSLAGVVRAHGAAKDHGLKLVIGAEITPDDGPAMVLWTTDRASYGRLARLITRGRRQAAKGECRLKLAEVLEHAAGLMAGVLPGAQSQISNFKSESSRHAPPCRPLCDDAADGPQIVPATHLALCREAFADRCYLLAELHYRGDDQAQLDRLIALSQQSNLPLVAAGDVHFHTPQRQPLSDLLTALRHGCTVATAGERLFPNAQRYLRSPQEMAALFARAPEAIERAVEIAARSTFSLDELRYEYPEELAPAGFTPSQYLQQQTWEGARRRYPHGVPEKVRQLVEHELALIDELHYEAYFLTVWDLVVFARSRGILCQGRGSAANSAVCFCLGVTSVDPERMDVLFERFVSRERNEAPDIDVDFEHERREEVLQYLYNKYGRDRAGMTAVVTTYRRRSAIRDVGRGLGLPAEAIDRLAKRSEHRHYGSNKHDDPPPDAQSQILNVKSEISAAMVGLARSSAHPTSTQISNVKSEISATHAADGSRSVPATFRDDDPYIDPGRLTYRPDARELTASDLSEAGIDPHSIAGRQFLALLDQLVGFPRHLSQHTGGMVMTRGPLCELVPIENAAMADRTVIQWNKDDLDELGILKVDCLALGMLTAIRKCFALVEQHYGQTFELATIPESDAAVYDMACQADTMGVFQIESRAQMSMLPRLKPRCFYDLVIQVAIVRPGPIQGNMVHPYLRRRNGEEAFEFPNDAIRGVLEKTLGVPLFQEQAMRLAVEAAGFTPGEADQLRRAMGAWRRPGVIDKFHEKFTAGMLGRGFTNDWAEAVFHQIRGFGEYGFPESHAASFALLVYVSCWLKHHYMAAFTAALLNSQPLGFYAPAQLVRNAREHGVEILPVDVNLSDWDCTLESSRHTPADRCGKSALALRLGLRLLFGLPTVQAKQVVSQRGNRPFKSMDDFARRTGLSRAAMVRLAKAGALGSLGAGRRRSLWDALGEDNRPLPLFDETSNREAASGAVDLPQMSPQEEVLYDYRTQGLSLKAHPLEFLRAELDSLGVAPARALATWPNGRRVCVAGLVLVRQRPSTAKGITFVTLEDETGVANLIIRPQIWQRYRTVANAATVLMASGVLQREGLNIHLLVSRLDDFSIHMKEMVSQSRDFC